MNRRTLVIALAVIAGAVLASQFLTGLKAGALTTTLFDGFFFLFAFVILSRVPAAENTGREAIRFVMGGLVFLLSLQSYALVVWLLGDTTDTSTVLLWLYIARVGPILGATWTFRSLLRLGGDVWERRRRQIVACTVILLFMFLFNAPVSLGVIMAAFIALFITPGRWMEELRDRYRWWLPVLFFIAPVVAIVFLGQLSPEFLENVQISDPELQESFEQMMAANKSLADGWNSIESGITPLTQACLVLSIYWMLLPIRMLLGAIQGSLGLRIPIWLKLAFTYVFSTIIPALLLLALIGVGIYAGLGIMRSRMVRTLIYEDLVSLGSVAKQECSMTLAGLDSVAVAVYERSAPRRRPDTPPAPLPFGDRLNTFGPSVDRFGDTRIEPNLATEPERGDFTLPELLGLSSLMGFEGSTGDVWVCRERLPATWQAPDTLMEMPGWTDTTRYQTAILPLETQDEAVKRAAYAAAYALPERARMIRVALRRLTPHVLDKYRKVVGVDITLLPTVGILVAENEAEDQEIQISSTSRMTISGEQVLTLPTVSTLKEDTASVANLWDQTLYHGVCELVDHETDTDQHQFFGIVTVHTTLKQVWGALFAPQGLNLVVLWVLGVLILLLLFAVSISSILGLGINRSITNAIKKLRVGTEQLRKGDLTTRIQVSSRDELGELAVSFNRMTADLNRMLLEVKEKERLQQEMQIARTIQLNLLPKVLPKVKEYQFGATSEPAFDVAGDYYECSLLDNGRLLLAVGDVTGKGAAAAILMSNLQASLRVLISADLDMPTVAKRLNEIIHRNSTPDMFITFFFALLDPSKHELVYVNAGHDYPLILRGGEISSLTTGGLMLGAMPVADYETGSLHIQPGDIFIAYSDGLTEAMNEEEEEYGVDRLVDAIKRYANLNANDIKRRVLQEVRAFAGRERVAADDLTLLIMKRLPKPDETA